MAGKVLEVEVHRPATSQRVFGERSFARPRLNPVINAKPGPSSASHVPEVTVDYQGCSDNAPTRIRTM
jgi:hypothetical protein